MSEQVEIAKGVTDIGERVVVRRSPGYPGIESFKVEVNGATLQVEDVAVLSDGETALVELEGARLLCVPVRVGDPDRWSPALDGYLIA